MGFEERRVLKDGKKVVKFLWRTEKKYFEMRGCFSLSIIIMRGTEEKAK